MTRETRPSYPFMAQIMGITGVVHILALVDTEGQVIAAKVEQSSSFYMFDITALIAAYKNKFEPAKKKDGEPIACWVTYNVEFRLDKE